MTVYNSRRGIRQYGWVLALALGIVVLAAPWLHVSAYSIRQITLIALLALPVSGFNLAFGYGGELAVGQVAMYCVGAYVAGYLAMHGNDMIVSLLGAAFGAALLGFLSGVPGLRLGGWGLAMSSFFLIVLIPDLVDLLHKYTGGLIGLTGIPQAKLFGTPLDAHALYVVIIVVCIGWFAFMRNLVTSRHGAALLVLRQSPVLSQSLGIGVSRTKLLAYVLGAVPAGIAGGLFAYLDHFVAPEYFTFDKAILIIAASTLGRSESIYGAIVGATLLQLGPMRMTAFQDYAFVAYGVFLILGGLLLTGRRMDKITSSVKSTLNLRRFAADTAAPAQNISTQNIASQVVGTESRAHDHDEGDGAPQHHLPGKLLRVEHLVKAFGGVKALNDVSLVAEPGKVTGLIGANGSGKTTLLNVVSGYYRADAGTVSLGERELGRGKPLVSARVGVSRTFQTPVIPRSMKVWEVVATARYSSHYSGVIASVLRTPSYRRIRHADESEARRWLDELGIGVLADVPAAALPLGSRRMVEVARALARDPALVLLDEAASGLSSHEVDALAALVRRIAAMGATVILVEHNFKMVCEASDVIFVLQLGELIAQGPPEDILRDEAVARSYLGSIGDQPDIETLPVQQHDAVAQQVMK